VSDTVSKSGLSGLQRSLILTAVVTQFLFLHGLVWRKLYDLDASILWSYASIPLLVLLALSLSRRLDLRHFFLATLEITLLKFLITASVLVLVLVLGGSPGAPGGGSVDRPIAIPSAPARAAAPPAAPSIIPAERRGTLTGIVRDAAGAPAADAVVYLSGGVDAYRFAPRSDAVELSNDGTGFRPVVAAIQVGQPLVLRALDGRLHTLAAEDADARQLFNAPVLSSGAPTTETFAEPYGVMSVWCTVAGAGESSGRLVVVAHPFFTRTDAAGRFTLADVPAGELEVSAIAGPSARGGKNVALPGQSTRELEIRLP